MSESLQITNCQTVKVQTAKYRVYTSSECQCDGNQPETQSVTQFDCIKYAQNRKSINPAECQQSTQSGEQTESKKQSVNSTVTTAQYHETVYLWNVGKLLIFEGSDVAQYFVTHEDPQYFEMETAWTPSIEI